MVELTDINLDSFLLRELRAVVAKHPRFRNLGGEVSSYYSTLMTYNDLQIVIKNPTADGTRLSPDHFMCTKMGRAILAKVGDKAGEFVEFVQEVDATFNTPQAGIYYLGVNTVDESTRAITLIQQLDKWYTGTYGPARGSFIYFDPNIYSYTDLTITNLTPADYIIGQDHILLLKYTSTVTIQTISTSHVLVPNTDYWLDRYESNVVVSSTIGGLQAVELTDTNYIEVNLVDQDGYVLVPYVDYYFSSKSEIVLSRSTPSGQTLSLVGTWRRNPSLYPIVDSENILNIPLVGNEEVISNQIKISTESGDYTTSSALTYVAGTGYYLTNLLQPGQHLVWSVRVTDPNLQTTINTKKNSLDLSIIPGLNIAIGDKVVVGDQVAILVNPTITETYDVYGSKEGISFDIDIKTNDMSTSSEIGQLIKRYMLVEGRERLETCGLTIYEISRSTIADQKDASGLTSQQHVILSVRAAADWELRKPLITYLDRFDLTGINYSLQYPGKYISIPDIATTYGNPRFATSYV